MQAKYRSVEYTHNTNGEVLDTDRFNLNTLEIESFESGFNNGFSMLIWAIDDEIFYDEWIWIDEIDEFDGEEFGWWIMYEFRMSIYQI